MKKPDIDRRIFLKFTATNLAAAVLPRHLLRAANESNKNDMPNFIVIFCDDLGYGDIGCFGSKKHNTPNIDQMAQQGIRFTSFYVTSGVCTPSRSSLMTGCYPRRTNMHHHHRRNPKRPGLRNRLHRKMAPRRPAPVPADSTGI
jgi:hypothetical protein